MKQAIIIGICMLLIGCNSNINYREYTQEELETIYEECEFPTYLFNTTSKEIKTVICVDFKDVKYYVYGDCKYSKKYFSDLPYMLRDNVECVSPKG